MEYRLQKYITVIMMLSSAFLLNGCIVHTTNDQPQVDSMQPISFSVESEESPLQSPWWTSFNRPALDKMITQSLSNNFDIVQSIAVLKQAEAVAAQTSTAGLPQINVTGAATQSWEDSDKQNLNTQVGAALSWEIDVWNRIGNAAKADRLQAQARAYDVETIKLSLSAEVANAYFGAVAAHRQIALLQKQLKLDTDLENLLQLRLKGGVGANFELFQQQARVAESKALIPIAQANLGVFENRLDVLLGQAPDAQRRVSSNDNLNFTSDLPAIDVPAALLLNRPDLLAARAELIAADADIGAAIADRLPRVTLDGSYAFVDGGALSGPVSMVMGAFIHPLLDWGRRKAEVERNEYLYEERLAAYTQLYLEAIEDVENALVQEQKQREFLKRLDAQRILLKRAVDAAEKRYKQGVDDYQPVINALRELRTVERNLVSQRQVLLGFRVDLFRAIGGPMYSAFIAEDNIDKGQDDEIL